MRKIVVKKNNFYKSLTFGVATLCVNKQNAVSCDFRNI